MTFGRVLAALACLLLSVAHGSNSVQTPQVQVSLLAEQPHYTPGQPLWLGLRFDLLPGWHVYWRNPGDSGEAPRIDWRLPDGWQASDIHWPVPHRIPVGHLVNYGYEDSVTLLVELQTTTADAGPRTIVANADWLVCRETCIPQQGLLRLELPDSAAVDAANPRVVSDFSAARGQWPVTLGSRAIYQQVDGTLQLRVDIPAASAGQIEDAWFAAYDWGPVAPSGRQQWSRHADGLRLAIPAGEMPPTGDMPLQGLLVVSERSGDGLLTRGIRLTATPGLLPPDTTGPPGPGIALALAFAFLGGLLLNLMPCVLPVLSIKIVGLVRHADGGAARHGLVFTAGVLSAFAALAAALIALRAAGEAIGWGFQLQEPLVVLGLMYLMLALGLNLSGVFSMGSRLMGLAGQAGSRHDLAGTFASGVLAVVVASPCTAPFMGGALGFALTQPAVMSLGVFLALGLGFATPLLLLSLWPAWLRLLPAPGAWMERLRNVLAFPMYAAAAWLLWVLSQQVTPTVLAAALAGAVLLSFALWWSDLSLHNRRRQRTVASTAAVAGMGIALLATLTQNQADQPSIAQASWSADHVRALQADGRAVFVNFTAAWCITCKVNEQVALDTDRVRAALEHHNIAYLKGDWTRRDPAITAELARHGRSGVPLYLLFPPHTGQPQVLPQFLTEGLVLQAIENI
ncbi:MAG: thioredoxin family protein [Gammaproteobacteria bacterium]|nr:thioredoxin family protein [Gammaproteobacteria bacterium]